MEPDAGKVAAAMTTGYIPLQVADTAALDVIEAARGVEALTDDGVLWVQQDAPKGFNWQRGGHERQPLLVFRRRARVARHPAFIRIIPIIQFRKR
jgi:hypothetical protein